MVGMQKKTEEDKKESEMSDEQDLKKNTGSTQKLNPKQIGVIMAVTLVVIIAFLIFLKSDDSEEAVQPQPAATESVVTPNPNANEAGVLDESGTNDSVDESLSNNEESFVQSDPNYSNSDKNETSAKVFDKDDYVKDLNGADVSAIYTVKSRDYVKTHVSYVAKRAIIDDGMEMYWLDVTYKKKKYRLQIPFYYFKDLDDEGICKVEIEVLNLENGGQIISYMQIIDEQGVDNEID